MVVISLFRKRVFFVTEQCIQWTVVPKTSIRTHTHIHLTHGTHQHTLLIGRPSLQMLLMVALKIRQFPRTHLQSTLPERERERGGGGGEYRVEKE